MPRVPPPHGLVDEADYGNRTCTTPAVKLLLRRHRRRRRRRRRRRHRGEIRHANESARRLGLKAGQADRHRRKTADDARRPRRARARSGGHRHHAQGTRDPLPPLPDGATGWCACRFCPSLIYSDDDLYCDFDDGPCFVCHRPRKGVDDVCGVIILQKELCDFRLQSSFILCVEQASKQGTCVRQIRGWQMEAYNEARTLCVDFR